MRRGREGLARFDPLGHEIVVTDFLMPGLTGLEIAAAVRARSPSMLARRGRAIFRE